MSNIQNWWRGHTFYMPRALCRGWCGPNLVPSLVPHCSPILAQLRTGMARLNGYLHRIGAAESDQCACGQATETVQHFLFRCTRWDAYRTQMLERTETRKGNLSFYLGGKAPSDPERWAPNLDAVRATIRYAMASGRLDTELEPTPTPQRQLPSPS